MPESTFKTIGHGQVNVFVFPIKATTSWTSLATPDLQFTQAQADRLTTAGVGAFDLALRKRHEVGRTVATQKVASSAIDKPLTMEWLEYGSMRPWNNLTGRAYDASTDITQADFDATSSECCVIVHKLDESSPAQVVESDIIWRCVVDTNGISVPNSQDDDLRVSVRLTGDEHIMTSNAAGKAICFLETASGGVVSLPASYRTVVERDDWPDDDDGTNERTVCIADEAAGATAIDVYATSGFSAGHDVIVRSTPVSWETTTISSVAANAITVSDLMDINHKKGAEFSRTRGHFLFVYNQTTGEYLEFGTDYRVKQTSATVTQIINVDGGSAIGATDEVWACWLIAAGNEMWTDNDSDLYGITHPMTKFMVSPESTFITTTTGWNGTAITVDTELDFTLPSGTNDDQEWIGVEFTAAATGKIDNFVIPLTRATAAGTSAGELYAELYTDDGGGTSIPSARRGNPSLPVRVADMVSHASGATTLAAARETFYFTDGPGVTSGTAYWAVLKTAGVQVATGVTSVSLLLDANGSVVSGVDNGVAKADPNLGATSTPTWTISNISHSADIDVNLIGSQEVKRIQGMDMSITFSRSAYYEMGNESPIERSFDETDVRVTVPAMASDQTSWTRFVDKNTSSVKTVRPEQNPVVWGRLEVYSTTAKNAGDIQLVYEFPSVQRSGGEKTAPANERMTKRITLTGDEFTIATAL